MQPDDRHRSAMETIWYAEVPRSVTRFAVLGILLMVMTFGGIGAWAFRAPLAAAVIAQGSFVATGRNKIVQHLEGGIIQEISVREGDFVEAGQLLLRLDKTASSANERELEVRRVRLEATEQRILAEYNRNEVLEFSKGVLAFKDDLEIASIIDGQALAFKVSQSTLQNDLTLLEQLSRIEPDEHFEAYLKQIVASHRLHTSIYTQQAAAALVALSDLQKSLPLLSNDVVEQLETAIATGQTLSQSTLSALDAILYDLTEQGDIIRLKDNLKDGQTRLAAAYGHQAQLSNRDRLQQKNRQLTAQRQQLQTDGAETAQKLTQIELLTQRLDTVETTLGDLGDPRGLRQVLQEQLQAMAHGDTEYGRLRTNHQTLETTLAELTSQLAGFVDLEAEISQQQQRQQHYQPGYLT